MLKLQDQLDQISEQTRRLVQPERLQPSEHAIAELFSTGIEQQILPVGSIAPEFSLPDANWPQLVRSADLLALGPLVIKFFRGRWCPYCMAELEAWRELYPERARSAARCWWRSLRRPSTKTICCCSSTRCHFQF